MKSSVVARWIVGGLLVPALLLAAADSTATSLAVMTGCSPPLMDETGPPAYYAIDLVPTGRVAGARRATGVAQATFARSPFGLAVSPSGEYAYDLQVRVADIAAPRDGEYVAWLATPDLADVQRLGVLDAESQARGRVLWNKFLVVVSLEPEGADAERWTGPIVLRGMSRSGRMHTMAGHGPYQAEPCARYGY